MAKRVKKAKDTQFLYISARVRSMESKMLTSDKLERMIDARTDEDALKVLSECGYPEVQDVSGLEKALGARRAEVFAELASAKNGAGLVDVFRLKYDCHNMKTLLKAAQAAHFGRSNGSSRCPCRCRSNRSPGSTRSSSRPRRACATSSRRANPHG